MNPLTQVAAPAPAPVEEPQKIEIEPTSSGASFFVKGVSGNEELKQKLKDIGGVYNTHSRGYLFKARDEAAVYQVLGLVKNLTLSDPGKMIEVQFTQKFQWNGDMRVAEEQLKAIGMVKAGRGNVWSGDLAKASVFAKTFSSTV